MKIVFWGTPNYAAENLRNIVKAGHEVIAVITQPDRKRGRGKKLSPSPVKVSAIDLGIPWIGLFLGTSRDYLNDKYHLDEQNALQLFEESIILILFFIFVNIF